MESPRPSSANQAVKLFLSTDSVQSQELKSCFEDWNELEQEFKQLEGDHDQYIKKLEEVKNLQKKCMGGIAHHRYRTKKIMESMKKSEKGLSENDKKLLAELQQKILNRKNTFREMEEFLPHKNGLYLRIILGQVNVSLLSKEDRFNYKKEYENFKLTVSSVVLALSFFLLIVTGYIETRWLDAVLHFLLVWYYCTLTIRENILVVNGSRIKGWWVYHHFISTVCAGISLIWPDSWSYQSFRLQYGYYSLYLALVQALQYYYQKGCLYRLRTLGERHDMDITVEGFMSWMWKGLAFILPFLFFGYMFQLYNAYVLYHLSIDPRCKEWQVFILCCIHLILFLGNMTTSLRVIHQKMKTDRLKLKQYKRKYRFPGTVDTKPKTS
ncbi:hypothetical protein ACJMK2_011536 [Sinanodonta woodiana]|uniref:Transmembrane protein 120A n=1 Tax=Sinanodonta woodiana TaxID=1069815 RepID=A0ABD3V5B8_SINWO